MRLLFISLIVLGLSGCSAREPTAEDLSALKNVAPTFALTPPLRNTIAVAVQRARTKPGAQVAKTETMDATISDLKFMIPPNGSAENPWAYYCVHVQWRWLIPNGKDFGSDYIAVVRHPEPNKYEVDLAWRKLGHLHKCEGVPGTPFSEVVNLMHTSEELARAKEQLF
jgi:hypothetical protein